VPEAYQSLYRRFRPQRFGELRGQERVAEALQRAVASGQVSHAYLFSGPRGTGKTSTARILAKALNCEALIDGEPCLACSSCIAVANGASVDVEELDAASNSGVDDIRALLQTVQTVPLGRWKVYIIDEVHMLTQNASNALLKTLEEPPSHVVFILATTNPSRILATVRSRTQHFAFRLLDDASIDALIDDVAAAVGVAIDEQTKTYVRNRGGGSARDTLSFLEQALALGAVSGDGIESAVALAEAIEARGLARAVCVTSDAFAAGVEPSELLADTAGHLGERFVELALKGARGSELARYSVPMEELGRLGASLRDSLDPRAVVFAGIARVIEPDERVTELEREVRSLGERITAREREVRSLAEAVGAAITPSETATSSTVTTQTTKERRVRAAPQGSSSAGDAAPTLNTSVRVPTPEATGESTGGSSALERIRRGRRGVGRGTERTAGVIDESARGEPASKVPHAVDDAVASEEAEVAASPLGSTERSQQHQNDWYDQVCERAPGYLKVLLRHVRAEARDGAIVLLCDQLPVAERLALRFEEVSALFATALVDEPPTIVVQVAHGDKAVLAASPAFDRSGAVSEASREPTKRLCL